MDILQIGTRGLDGIIDGGITAKDYSAVTGIGIKESETILDSLLESGIGHTVGDTYSFERGDRLKVAMMMLEHGVPLDEVAEKIDWRDFEGLVSEMFASKDFAVVKNFRFKKPVMEIDVIGTKMGIAILVDCKHWKYTARSSMLEMVRQQIARVRRYVQETKGAIAAPAIVTLYQHETELVDNVPVIPVSKFGSFLDEFYGNIDKMKTIAGD